MLLLVILAPGARLGPDGFKAFTSDPHPTSTPAGPAAAPGFGSQAVDGKFSFVVTEVERPGKTMPGKNHTRLTALGEFVIVRVNVTNEGTVAQSLDVQSQVLLSDRGCDTSPVPRSRPPRTP